LNDDSSDLCIKTKLHPLVISKVDYSEASYSYESFIGFIFTMLMLLIGYTITLSVMARSIVYEKKLKIKVKSNQIKSNQSFLLFSLMNFFDFSCN